jgi:hypothetical protein
VIDKISKKDPYCPENKTLPEGSVRRTHTGRQVLAVGFQLSKEAREAILSLVFEREQLGGRWGQAEK